ncbi:uncharacterized protein [Palaemon carinicauda]|uniref:uncharacterized protein n=1 Tax=Palaemon carinicauda TaxID=392227 RepID=UPI0035B5DB3E
MNMDLIKRRLRGKQMMIDGLRSENALLRQSLVQRRPIVIQDSQGTCSSNVVQSSNSASSLDVPPNRCVTQLQGSNNSASSLDVPPNRCVTQLQGSSNSASSLDVPPNRCVTQLQGHSVVQQNQETQVPHEKQIRQHSTGNKQDAVPQRQQHAMPSSSKAKQIPTQPVVQYAAAYLEEIESFFHNIENQLQSSQNEGNGKQSASISGQTQQSSNQTHSNEHIETNVDVEVTYVTSVRAVQTQKRTPNLQPIQIDKGNNPCQTVPQQNMQRSSLPKQTYNTFTHNTQTSQHPSQQSAQGLQSANQVHTNSTGKHLLPQYSPQQHFVRGPHPHEHLHKNPSMNLQLPNHSPQTFLLQRHQNPQQINNSLPQSHHSTQHSPQAHFQNAQQIPNNASHNVHPSLQSPQSQIQRFHNPQQIQRNANYNVQPSQQHLQWPFVQQPSGNSTHRFQPPQHSPHQPFQGPPNVMLPHQSPSIGPLPQQAKSIQVYSNSQQSLQRQQPPPSQFGNPQSIGNVQTNHPPLQRPNLPSETFHRPQHSSQNQDQRPKHARVMPPPLYRAPFLPQQNQQLHVTPQHSQGVSLSNQQMSLSHGYEQAHGSQRSHVSSTKRKQQIISEDKRIGDPSSIQNSLGNTHASRTNSPNSPLQNKEPHITQPQASPSNRIERHKNISSPVMESDQKIVRRNQQTSDSLPSTSTGQNSSCTQNKDVSENEEAREVQEQISTVMCQEEKSILVETSKQNTQYVEGPFLGIVKEEPLSELPDCSMGTNHQWSNIGKKINIEDSLGVSEFFHLEEITDSVPVAKLSNRPEIISGPKKKSSVRESSLDRNTDLPPQSIITPPQTPPTPIPSTSARGASPGLSLNATHVMKALANQASHHAVVDSDFTYCSSLQDNENMPVPNGVSDETKAPIDSLQTLNSTFCQRNKSNESASFPSKPEITDTLDGNSEDHRSISETSDKGSDDLEVHFSVGDSREHSSNICKSSEKGSGDLEVKISLENNKNDPQGISDHATTLASPSPDDDTRLIKAPDNSPQEELEDQKLCASNSVKIDKNSKLSDCQEFSFPKNRNSQESSSSKEEISLEQVCKEAIRLEQAITPAVSSNIECSEVCPNNSSGFDKPSGNSFDKEGNNVDRCQPVRHKECVTDSLDSVERSQQVEYLIETVESDSVKGVNNSSLLENSLSDLDGLVEYVHISDYPDECEIKFSPKYENVDEQTDCEVSDNESNVSEKMWRIENDIASRYDNDSVLKIFISVDEVTGKLTDQKEIPECCPLCYTDICPSTITVSAVTFDMKVTCVGCNLTILMIWGSEAKTCFDDERPCPKSKKRKLNSIPKLLFVRQ